MSRRAISQRAISTPRSKRWAGVALAVALASARMASAFCTTCYLDAGSAGTRGVRALQQGILILLIPTLLAFAGLFLVAYRRRHPAAGVANNPPAEPAPHPDHDLEAARLPFRAAPEGHLPFVP